MPGHKEKFHFQNLVSLCLRGYAFPLMSKTALLFAGQGAQVVGMGKDLAEKFPSAKAWFDRANAALGYDLAGICFNGPEADLTKTENAQPGIFLVSWVAFQLLKEQVQSPMSKVQSPGSAGTTLDFGHGTLDFQATA